LNLHPTRLQQSIKIVIKLFLAACHPPVGGRGNGLSLPVQQAGATSSLVEVGGVYHERSLGRISASIPGRVRTLLNHFTLRSTPFSSLIFFILLSCSKPIPTFENLDIAKWKEDKAACGQVRQNNLQELTRQKDKLKGLSQDAIVELLGRPDQNELYKRNQKFFYYLLTPGKECGSDSTAHRLSLRFNAMGFAKEVLVE
jgi:outer membrane protein assembly factor BamE (lipoprotein component of BamABCDE complex)